MQYVAILAPSVNVFVLQVVSQQFAGMKFRVSAKNDEMIAPRLYHNTPLLGAVVGVELKKRLGWQGIRQGEAEWLLFAHDIHYPFCQVLQAFLNVPTRYQSSSSVYSLDMHVLVCSS